MVFREEEITREILLQEFKRFESENVKDDPRIRYCDYCEKPKTILLEVIRKNYMGIENEELVRFEIDSKKHNFCYKIAKYDIFFYDDELESIIQTSVALMEPVLIVVMGLVIGFIIMLTLILQISIFGKRAVIK